jgi:hypothetical protein
VRVQYTPLTKAATTNEPSGAEPQPTDLTAKNAKNAKGQANRRGRGRNLRGLSKLSWIVVQINDLYPFVVIRGQKGVMSTIALLVRTLPDCISEPWEQDSAAIAGRWVATGIMWVCRSFEGKVAELPVKSLNYTNPYNQRPSSLVFFHLPATAKT